MSIEIEIAISISISEGWLGRQRAAEHPGSSSARRVARGVWR
jgi:hypothetical protein